MASIATNLLRGVVVIQVLGDLYVAYGGFRWEPEKKLMFLNFLCIIASYCFFFYVQSGGGTVGAEYMFVVLAAMNFSSLFATVYRSRVIGWSPKTIAAVVEENTEESDDDEDHSKEDEVAKNERLKQKLKRLQAKVEKNKRILVEYMEERNRLKQS